MKGDDINEDMGGRNMKVIICCPRCGDENLEPKKKDNPYVYVCNKCKHEFDSMWGGLKTYKNGNVSDEYHTFDELYHHRMILFSIICNTYKDLAWKSWKHSDGTMYDDYFIVGVTTALGDYTYHYHKDDWELFEVKELDNAPEWDGHKPEDINRLFGLLAYLDR